jgi:hypothetical protein
LAEGTLELTIEVIGFNGDIEGTGDGMEEIGLKGASEGTGLNGIRGFIGSEGTGSRSETAEDITGAALMIELCPSFCSEELFEPGLIVGSGRFSSLNLEEIT